LGGINRILLLRALKAKELVEQMASGEIILAPKGERIVDERSFYAAFVTAIEYGVECAGNQIGVLPADNIPELEQAILQAGRRWQVQSVDHGHRQISVIPAKGKTTPIFSGSGGQIHPRIMQEMCQILQKHGEIAFLNSHARTMLATRTQTIWFPWAGSRVLQTLSAFAALDRLYVKKDLISLTYDCPQERFQELRSDRFRPVNACRSQTGSVPNGARSF
jgi:ATP-dependent Lhr-like helicase